VNIYGTTYILLTAFQLKTKLAQMTISPIELALVFSSYFLIQVRGSESVLPESRRTGGKQSSGVQDCKWEEKTRKKCIKQKL